MKIRRLLRHYDPETGDTFLQKAGPLSRRDAIQQQHTPSKPTKASRAAKRRIRRRLQELYIPPPPFGEPTPRQQADDPERYLTRRQVLREAGHRCAHCGTSHNLTVDHIIPLVLGGGNHRENLQCLCKTCNKAKGDSLPCDLAA